MLVGVLFSITSPYFVAGIIADHYGVVVKAAPIVDYMRGRKVGWVKSYCERRDWQIREVGQHSYTLEPLAGEAV